MILEKKDRVVHIVLRIWQTMDACSSRPSSRSLATAATALEAVVDLAGADLSPSGARIATNVALRVAYHASCPLDREAREKALKVARLQCQRYVALASLMAADLPLLGGVDVGAIPPLGTMLPSSDCTLGKRLHQLLDLERSLERVGRSLSAALALPYLKEHTRELGSVQDARLVQQSLGMLGRACENGVQSTDRPGMAHCLAGLGSDGRLQAALTIETTVRSDYEDDRDIHSMNELVSLPAPLKPAVERTMRKRKAVVGG